MIRAGGIAKNKNTHMMNSAFNFFILLAVMLQTAVIVFPSSVTSSSDSTRLEQDPDDPSELVKECYAKALIGFKEYDTEYASALISRAVRLSPQGTQKIAGSLMEEWESLLSSEPNVFEAMGMAESLIELARTLSDETLMLRVADKLLALELFPEAERVLQAAVLINPSSGLAQFQLGQTLFYLQRHEESLQSLTRALRLEPRLNIHNQIGLVLWELERDWEALQCHELAERLNPSYAVTRVLVEQGKMQLQARMRQTAAKSFYLRSLRGEEEEEEEHGAIHGRCCVECERGDDGGIEGTRREGGTCAGSSSSELFLASDASAQGLSDLQLFKRGDELLARHELDEAVADRVQKELRRDSLPPLQVVCFTRLLQLSPSLAVAYNQLGIAWSRKRDFMQALEAFSNASKLEDLSFVRNNVGVLLARMGELDRAEESFERAKALAPSYKHATHNLMLLEFAKEKAEELVRDIRTKLQALSLAFRSQQLPIVLAGYRREGDGLGSHLDNIREKLEEERSILIDEIASNQSSLIKRTSFEYRIYLTLFESDRLPSSWKTRMSKSSFRVEILNNRASEVWTADSWQRENFWASGVHLPIKLFPLGTNVDRRGEKFTFTLIANLQERKGVLETVDVFLDTFSDSSDVLLRVHAKWHDEDVLRGLEERMERIEKMERDKVDLSLGLLEEEEYERLWLQTDCIVALSKAYKVRLSGREGARYAFTQESTGEFLSIDKQHAREKTPLSWGEATKKFEDELNKSTLVFASSLRSHCGVSTYTLDLFSDLPGVAFASSWQEVFVFCRLFSIALVHVQHEHGIFPVDNEFLTVITEVKVASLLTLSSLAPKFFPVALGHVPHHVPDEIDYERTELTLLVVRATSMSA
ncbi:hypothetical protein GUITHDRAFT_135427 [Guillardia theta CCMP2712]|uniref:Tetratricopeptide repeat protein n=1 Tax=Guillardia theta (strain CCMP2712) TaxID=905079 RepID=L1JQ18_GUITC|nr:hypothetical protein GUITHDRAFT_135427 [Guillardia theta CCMP2712]EKX50265.1 hypothetical protein GUITHDRAFT_135427 [Guillardia theta CCMP2712]|eukprot:XP_005837245.1 hypothetical protein GUITHDRAFT_135427 [Guillardia theta CCMP2712]